MALAVSGSWRGTNKCKLYEELGWEYLYHRRWYRRLIHYYKLKQSRLRSYLYNLIPPKRESHYGLRRANSFDQPIERTNRYSNTYFQNCSKEWNRLDISVRSSQTISKFKKRLIQIVRPVESPFLMFTTYTELSYLLGLMLNSVTFVVTGIITIFIVLDHPVPAKLA